MLSENGELIFYKNEIDSAENSKVSPNGFDKPKVEKIIVETDGLNLQHVGIINNFTNSILGLEEMFIDGQEGINGVELMNAIELSGWKQGQRITLPVDEEEYLKELNIRIKNPKEKRAIETIVVDTKNTFGS